MLWCRYLKSRPAIVASNFWASKYFGADSFSKFGILGFVLQKYRSASSYLMFFQDFLSLLVPRLDLLSLLDLCLGSVLLLSMWLFAYDCIIAAFYLSSTWFVTPQTVQDHKTCPSTNSRATICQCQWDATIHGYLGSLFAEQLFPSKRSGTSNENEQITESSGWSCDQIKSSAGGNTLTKTWINPAVRDSSVLTNLGRLVAKTPLEAIDSRLIQMQHHLIGSFVQEGFPTTVFCIRLIVWSEETGSVIGPNCCH